MLFVFLFGTVLGSPGIDEEIKVVLIHHTDHGFRAFEVKGVAQTRKAHAGVEDLLGKLQLHHQAIEVSCVLQRHRGVQTLLQETTCAQKVGKMVFYVL